MYNCVQLRWDWKFYELSCLWPLLTSSTVGQMASQRVALPTNCSFSSDYTPLGRGRVQYEGNINSIFHRSAPVNSWPSSSISNVLSKTFIGFIKICCVDHKGQSSSLVKTSAWRCKMPVDFLRILLEKNLVIAGGEPSCHFGRRPSSACEPESIYHASVKLVVEYSSSQPPSRSQPLQASAVGCTWKQNCLETF